MDAKSLLLMTAFRHVISEPNIEAGIEKLRAITCCADDDSFREAVAACLRDGLIHEPIRLPEGALQCHWHLELTPKGVEAARALLDRSTPAHPMSLQGGEADEATSSQQCAYDGRGIVSSASPPRNDSD